MKKSTRIIALMFGFVIAMGCNLSRNLPTPTQTPPAVPPTKELVPTNTAAPPTPTYTLEPTNPPVSTKGAEGEPGTLPYQIGSGELALVGIQATMEDTIGQVLSIKVKNTADETVQVTIPCGLIFEPEDDSFQPMMVIQEASMDIEPGATAELYPGVACVDVDTGIPYMNANYKIGKFAEGDLLAMSECMCKTQMDFSEEGMDQISAQFAIWLVADADLLLSPFDREYLEDSPLGNILGGEGESTQELQDAIEAMRGAYLQYGKEWFEKCGLELPVTPTP